MKASEVNPWFGRQGGQSGDEVQGLEDHTGSAVAIGCFQLIVPSLRGQYQNVDEYHITCI